MEQRQIWVEQQLMQDQPVRSFHPLLLVLHLIIFAFCLLCTCERTTHLRRRHRGSSNNLSMRKEGGAKVKIFCPIFSPFPAAVVHYLRLSLSLPHFFESSIYFRLASNLFICFWKQCELCNSIHLHAWQIREERLWRWW